MNNLVGLCRAVLAKNNGEANRPGGPQGAAARAKAANQAKDIDLVALFFALLDKYKIILACAVLGAVLAVFYSLYTYTPVYQATTKLYVVSSGESLTSTVLNLGAQLKWDYAELLSFWEVRERVLEKLGVDYSYETLGRAVTINVADSSRLMTITARWGDPEMAMNMANAYAEVAQSYISEVMGVNEPPIATRALRPSSPINASNRRRTAMMGFLIGALIPAAIYALLHILDDKIRTAEDVQNCIPVPVMAALPLDKNNGTQAPSGKGKRRRRQ